MKKSLRVLLVEDEEADFRILEYRFRQLPYAIAIEWASTYELGLTTLLENRHDVALVDARLADNSGVDLVEAALAGSCTVPLIMMTGAPDGSDADRILRCGASDYLAKHDLDGPTLQRTIRYTLERHEHVMELRRTHDELLRLQRLKESFVSTVSHELRTPLTAIGGAASLLSGRVGGDLSARQAELVGMISRHSDRLGQLVDELLVFEKPAQ